MFDEGSPILSVVGTMVVIDTDSDPNRASSFELTSGDTSFFRIQQTPGGGAVLSADIASLQVCVCVCMQVSWSVHAYSILNRLYILF